MPNLRARIPWPLLVASALVLCFGIRFMIVGAIPAGSKHYALVADDALISMTYAQNLLDGYGLDWSRRGDPVEGFTHPLWLGLMVLLHLLPLEQYVNPFLLQALSLALLLVNLVLCYRYLVRVLGVESRVVQGIVLALIATYYPLNYWSLMGMETALQAVLVMAALLMVHRIEEGDASQHWVLGGLLGLAYLLRMDLLLIAVVIHVFFWRTGVIERDRRQWLRGLWVLLVVVAAYQVFRVSYFGEWLPNTYYLKLTGVPLTVRLLRGLAAFGRFLSFHVVLIVLVSLVPMFKGGRRSVALPLALVLVTLSYSVWVGGDVWDFSIPVQASRFVAFAMPLLFLLASGVLKTLLEQRRHLALAMVALLVALEQVDLRSYPATRETARNLLVLDPPPQYFGNLVIHARLEKLRELVPEDSSVAVYWAGIPAYYSRFRMMDLLGYNDRHIARVQSPHPFTPTDWQVFTPGHMKWDYAYVLEHLKPDAFFHIWAVPDEEIARMMKVHGYRKAGEFWLRDGVGLASSSPPPG